MLFLAFILASFTGAFAQQRVVDVSNGDHNIGPSSFFTVAGTPFVSEKYVRLVEGTPYFRNEWMKGVLVGEKGQEYKGYDVKLNLHDPQILYKDEKGNELIATTRIKEVVLTDAFGGNYKFIHSSFMPVTASPLKEGWYQWLVSGTGSLYKYYNKTLNEQKPYNSATFEQRISTKETYLVHVNNAFLEIKKLKDAPEVLAFKKAELEDFLKNKDDKKAGMDDRFAALIEYYNSLTAKEKK